MSAKVYLIVILAFQNYWLIFNIPLNLKKKGKSPPRKKSQKENSKWEMDGIMSAEVVSRDLKKNDFVWGKVWRKTNK